MADPFEPAPEAPALTAQDRGDGAQRRRITMSTVQARESLRQHGPHNLGNEAVADDESANFGSAHGDTIDSAITTLVGQLTSRDEDVQIGINAIKTKQHTTFQPHSSKLTEDSPKRHILDRS